MSSRLRPVRRTAIAVLLILAAGFATATTAAAAEPGEASNWAAQTYDDGDSDVIIHSPDTMAEAITVPGSAVHRVRVWRGADNVIEASVDGGPSFTPAPTDGVTTVAPRVVWDGARMTIYHTGLDGHVYISSNPDINHLNDPHAWSSWSVIGVPNLRTRQSVSVVHLSGHGTQAYITWRGYDDSDQTIYGAFYNGAWGPPSRISNGRSYYAATLTWNESRQRIFAFIAGYNSQQLYYAYQDYGHAWTNFAQLGDTGVTSTGSPAAATLSNGDMEIAYTGVNGYVYHGWWPRLANFNNWSGVVGGLRSNVAPYVVAVGLYAYLEATRRPLTGNAGEVAFKVGLHR
jgi:hypothetical protein